MEEIFGLTQHPDTSLRISQPDDCIFLKELFCANIAAKFPVVDAEIKKQLIELQYKARQTAYASDYPNATVYMIECHKEPIGVIQLDLHKNSLKIINIEIHPNHQNMGIAARVIKLLQKKCCSLGILIELSVANNNSYAIRLYRKTGFQIATLEAVYTSMIWTPE